jgi:hypothetical protein
LYFIFSPPHRKFYRHRKATLYLQLFDDDDDVDDLIGDLEIKLSDYLKKGDDSANRNDTCGQWMKLNNQYNKGEIRIYISFQKRELGPSAVRKLNHSLVKILTAPKWGLVEMMKPALMKLYLDMIKSGSIGNEDIRSGKHTNKSAKELEECTPAEELVWKTQQYCYNHPTKSRQLIALQKLMQGKHRSTSGVFYFSFFVLCKPLVFNKLINCIIIIIMFLLCHL